MTRRLPPVHDVARAPRRDARNPPSRSRSNRLLGTLTRSSGHVSVTAGPRHSGPPRGRQSLPPSSRRSQPTSDLHADLAKPARPHARPRGSRAKIRSAERPPTGAPAHVTRTHDVRDLQHTTTPDRAGRCAPRTSQRRDLGRASFRQRNRADCRRGRGSRTNAHPMVAVRSG